MLSMDVCWSMDNAGCCAVENCDLAAGIEEVDRKVQLS